MSAAACYAGVIVSDLDRAVTWYRTSLGWRTRQDGAGWAVLACGNGSTVELLEGDRSTPGLSFPSYGADPGPPLLPGVAVSDPTTSAAGRSVARQLPDWIIVVAPDGLRVVLTVADTGEGPGLVGFRWASPHPDAQRAFLADLGIPGPVEHAPTPLAGGVVAAGRDDEITDPDGTPWRLVRDIPPEYRAGVTG